MNVPLTAVLARAMPLIEAAEGFRAAPYLCAAGVASIGFGATHYADGRAVTLADAPVTRATAQALLQNMLAKLWDAVAAVLTRAPTVNQAAAMLSLAYNIGAQAFARSRLAAGFNAGDMTAAADQFPAWDRAHVNGVPQKLPGLAARRAAERALFLTSEPGAMT